MISGRRGVTVFILPCSRRLPPWMRQRQTMPSTARSPTVSDRPCVTTLERNDIGAAGRDRFYFAMQQAIAPVDETKTDYAIYSALADRLGFKAQFTEGRTEMGWLRHLYDLAR